MPEIRDIIERVMAGSCDEVDLQTIAAAIQSGQITWVSGSSTVGVSGDVENSLIVPGSHNIIGSTIVLPGEAVAEIQDLLNQRLGLTQTSAIPLDELVQQVQQRCRNKVIKLYSKIQLLNRQQFDIDRLYVDVYVLEKLSNASHATIPGLLEGREPRDSFDRLGLGKREKRSPGLDVAAEYSRLMVLGKPGSGKSTFLRHLAVVCAREEFRKNSGRPYEEKVEKL